LFLPPSPGVINRGSVVATTIGNGISKLRRATPEGSARVTARRRNQRLVVEADAVIVGYFDSEE